MKKYFISFSLLLPSLTYAAGGDILSILDMFKGVIWTLSNAVVLLAFVMFFYGLAKFILASGDPKQATIGKNFMIWGTIAIFVMMSITGIVGFFQRSVGATDGPGDVKINIPTLK